MRSQVKVWSSKCLYGLTRATWNGPAFTFLRARSFPLFGYATPRKRAKDLIHPSLIQVRDFIAELQQRAATSYLKLVIEFYWAQLSFWITRTDFGWISRNASCFLCVFFSISVELAFRLAFRFDKSFTIWWIVTSFLLLNARKKLSEWMSSRNFDKVQIALAHPNVKEREARLTSNGDARSLILFA